ncbi:MAG: efflux transporter periplasmic adaptor subunit [Zetaproteobacteria bacterium CG12_big_fil_rev_8_21_14_0_65_54_13]|nr:MAG: efflux transporter periplasmic adaptor subunit [Zetaproteobacteria bacterium CG23_combo_of_CG06-09_8_20_14_all_54_7]PIW48714.1 MAG: efflux transporter periplasmic adaptor subunit [Zetaproteobacteria bacterium CG12_big_fil_rev_8_21_14_0_65_54_13]PIX53294.1 MAG: efflux transporter periplasmic adaptor subunit [Zetaproteobacteria bacterium CG_4_10_14_3_um_filter_54_28]PJA29910.1 MAG: efflux transporter periplasmic adaptor subunit [Zetaproteobacteria bacterium CG_4_9_14_3_um_filter_54_145]
MIIMLAVVGTVFGGLIGFQQFKAHMMSQWLSGNGLPPATVTTMTAEFGDWQPEIRSVGTLRALHGVDIVSEVAGIVEKLHFKSGDSVKAGELLLELDAATEQAQLDAATAAAALAAITLERDQAQLKVKAVSQAQLDMDLADLKVKQAQAAQLRAALDKMRMRAPFSGKLGVTAISPGQYIRPGEVIVSLQASQTLMVDFNIPQRQLPALKVGQQLRLGGNGLAEGVFIGEISAIDSRANASTRNVRVEGRVDNADGALLPGMYTEVHVASGKGQRYLTLPQTAVSYNAYGSTLFLAKPASSEVPAEGKPALPVAEQVFVKTGLTRGDQIAVLSGIHEGDIIVTSGQMKLKNGTPLIVNNSQLPAFDPAPQPQEQ